jgi:glycosyltransferase involved in cell wall biosynthesis
MPRVSVLMPAYNVERYVADAAHSVLRQTYTELELIIANDGSTDGTAAEAERVRASDPNRVRVLTLENRGPSGARNAGLGIARGEFLALLDSDDMWEPPFLASQMAVFDAHPEVDLVSGNGRYLGGRLHGQPTRPWPDPRPPLSLSTIVSDPEAVFVMTVFRRRVVDCIGGFDERLRGNEDFDYWLRAALAGFRFWRNDEPLGWYRRREDSLSADGARMLRGAIAVCVGRQPLFDGRPERALLERQIEYYRAELEAELARQALAEGDANAGAAALEALRRRRPSWRTALAARLARYAWPVLAALYQMKRAYR